jgi:hypothetical protein
MARRRLILLAAANGTASNKTLHNAANLIKDSPSKPECHFFNLLPMVPTEQYLLTLTPRSAPALLA